MPPNTPFQIAGRTLDAFGNVVGSVSIIVSDDRLNERVTDVSDSNGNFSVNPADLPSQWQANDIITTIGKKGSYTTFKRIYTLTAVTEETLAVNQDLLMVKEEAPFNPADDAKMSFGEAMAKSKRAFWKGIEEYTLTGGWVERKSSTDEYLEIPQGHTAYINQLITGADDATDDYHIRILKNSAETADGASIQVGRELSFNAGTNGNIRFEEPIRITYNSTNARSALLAIKGGGTTSKVSASFKGFILRE